MIASLITSVIDLLIPIINIFIKNAEKNRQLKEQMFRLAEKHSANVVKNVQIRKDLEYLREEIKKGPQKKEQPNGDLPRT